MSYLDNLRIVFAGDFQTDVSTVNNDVRHYDNATFEKRFQEFQEGPVWNGWWNPIGSNAFRLIDCRVKSVYYQDGSSTTNVAEDPVIDLVVGGSNNRVGAKLVDLDPQWQLASQIWGLEMQLTDGKKPSLFSGHFQPAGFRDILFGRQEGGSGGDQTAAAMFQSVLTDLYWSPDCSQSRFLKELQAATKDNRVSVRLTTFGYGMDRSSDRFTIGTVIGTIGPYCEKEPDSFILGRRMVPLNGDRTFQNINFFDCQVKEEGDRFLVFADLSNALPLADGFGSLTDIGDLQLAVLKRESYLENNRVTEGYDFVPLGSNIPYRDRDWLRKTGGVWSVAVAKNDLELDINQNPLALLYKIDSRNAIVAIRESKNGWLVRTENFVQRVDAGESFHPTLFAATYGVPSQHQIELKLLPPIPGQGGGGGVKQPKAAIPIINTPAEALVLPQPKQTGSDGKITLTVETKDPGNPRKYIDGQLYMLQYQIEGQSPNQQHQFDYIFLHLYDKYQVPVRPTWENIQPLLQQYSNLYPIMGKQLFDLGDYKAVIKNIELLKLAFSLNISDPNYMPVTRDLSKSKQETILKWLENPDKPKGIEDAPLQLLEPRSVGEAIAAKQPVERRLAAEIETGGESEELGSKTSFYRSLMNQQQSDPEV